VRIRRGLVNGTGEEKAERGLDRAPTPEEVMRDVEAKVARATGAS
jgi:hypothetical protein